MVPRRSTQPLTVVLPDIEDSYTISRGDLADARVLNFRAFASVHLVKVMDEYFETVRRAPPGMAVRQGFVLRVDVTELDYPVQSAASRGALAAQFRARFVWRAALYHAEEPDTFLFSYSGIGESPYGFGSGSDTVEAWESAIEDGLQDFLEALAERGIIDQLIRQ